VHAAAHNRPNYIEQRHVAVEATVDIIYTTVPNNCSIITRQTLVWQGTKFVVFIRET